MRMVIYGGQTTWWISGHTDDLCFVGTHFSSKPLFQTKKKKTKTLTICQLICLNAHNSATCTAECLFFICNLQSPHLSTHNVIEIILSLTS